MSRRRALKATRGSSVSVHSLMSEPSLTRWYRIDRTLMAFVERGVVAWRGDECRRRRQCREIARVPVADRKPAEQRRAARRGVRAIDGMELDLQRIGEQLPPARIDRARPQGASRQSSRRSNGSHRDRPATKTRRLRTPRASACRACRPRPRPSQPPRADGFIHGERSPLRYGRKLTRADALRGERVLVGAGHASNESQPRTASAPRRRSASRPSGTSRRWPRDSVQARDRRRRIVRHHDDLAARAGGEQRVAVAAEAAAERGARRIARADRHHDARLQSERARRLGGQRARPPHTKAPTAANHARGRPSSSINASSQRPAARRARSRRRRTDRSRSRRRASPPARAQPVLRLQRPARFVEQRGFVERDPAQERPGHAGRDRIDLRPATHRADRGRACRARASRDAARALRRPSARRRASARKSRSRARPRARPPAAATRRRRARSTSRRPASRPSRDARFDRISRIRERDLASVLVDDGEFQRSRTEIDAEKIAWEWSPSKR